MVPSAITSGTSTSLETFDVSVHTDVLRLVPKFQRVDQMVHVKEVRNVDSPLSLRHLTTWGGEHSKFMSKSNHDGFADGKIHPCSYFSQRPVNTGVMRDESGVASTMAYLAPDSIFLASRRWCRHRILLSHLRCLPYKTYIGERPIIRLVIRIRSMILIPNMDPRLRSTIACPSRWCRLLSWKRGRKLS